MRKLHWKRIASISLTAVLSSTFAAGNIIAFADKNSVAEAGSVVPAGRYDTVTAENLTGKMDLSAVALQHLAPSVIENTKTKTATKSREATLIVTLGDGVISSADGSVADFLQTNEGKRTLNNVIDKQHAFFNALTARNISYTYVDSYTTVVNAVAIRTNTSKAADIRRIDGVEGVAVSRTYQTAEVTTDEQGAVVNPHNVYGTGIYDSSEYVSRGTNGAGIVVAVLDSGFDYTHEAFQKAPDSATLGMTYADVSSKFNSEFAAYRHSLRGGTALTARDVYVSDKIPFAYDYADDDADVYPSYSNHGTHVSGIIAGQADSYQDKDGNTPTYDDNGVEKPIPFRGVAPEAQLVLMKVFTDNLDDKDIGGATTEDIVAALEDCTYLGVDIVNMSLGTVAGFSTDDSVMVDDEGKLLKKYYTEMHAAGIALYAAASNEFSSGFGSEFGTNLATNPDSGTVGSPSTFIGAMSVASINGQQAPYLKAGASTNADTLNESGQPVYFQDSSDANMVQYDFVEDMLKFAGGADSALYKYVMIPGTGRAVDYTSAVTNHLNNKTLNGQQSKVIAVVKRGGNTFKEKIETAMGKGADAVIVYNNVAGMIRMNLGELTDPVPSIFISMDAGAQLNTIARSNSGVGYLLVNRKYVAGPFMNDYSSWGVTPDLRLKPDITSHGGEITSSVPGGYAEQSGTSMATPNLAGFAALLFSELKSQHPTYTSMQITELANQIIMSTATCVYDQQGLPYSPRKQGAGLAVLDNVFHTSAYLSEGAAWVGNISREQAMQANKYYTAEDNRPKAELRDDKDKTGIYNITFKVNNPSANALTFSLKSIFMTETLASDKKAVAEAAHLFNENATWSATGGGSISGGKLTVNANGTATVTATLSMSAAEKRYINTNFPNGMFVEGYLQLLTEDTQKQYCNLSLPFVGFFGDWDKAPLLDYDAFEIAASEKDASIKEEDKLKPSVWATQAYGTYYNEKYSVPLGTFLYLQDENKDQIYTDVEHSAISRYNLYYGADGEDSYNNYLTTTSIKALYVGLLRNCEMATYRLYDDYTGALIKEDVVYRLGKAYSNGGSSVPSQLLLEMYPEEMGFTENGKYRMQFSFFRTLEAYENQNHVAPDENTFEMVFYVDYSSPVLMDQRVRYRDYKENNKEKQEVYLDLDIYDNHYAQSVMLCYMDDEDNLQRAALRLATEYITPIYNAKKNGMTTVSINVTDFYEQYNGRLYIQIDDYALNHSVYRINFTTASMGVLPNDFSLKADGKLAVDKNGNATLTLGVNETYKVALDYEGNANISNFSWETTGNAVKVKNGEIFAASEGTQIVYVSAYLGNREISREITVTVTEGNKAAANPTFTFGVIKDSSDNLVKATGAVKVNPGEHIELVLVPDPWYYSMEGLTVTWASTNTAYATVENSPQDAQKGIVHVIENEKRGTAAISATVFRGTTQVGTARVTLSVQEPFMMDSVTLMSYHGDGGVVKIPDDRNIMTIGEEAFRDNDNITAIIIPKTVTQISERAFLNCTALEAVYFVRDPATVQPGEVVEISDLNLIYRDAFKGCTSLKKLDLTYNKVITVAQNAFANTPLTTIVHMERIGTAYDGAFRNTKLTEVDLTGLHVAGSDVFRDCAELETVTTGYYTAIGTRMFYDCASLSTVTVTAPRVGNNAFENSGVSTVNFVKDSRYSYEFEIGAAAFRGCSNLANINFNNNAVYSIGNEAFANCLASGFALSGFALDSGTVYGSRVFAGSAYHVGGAQYYDDGTDKYLMLAPETVTDADFMQSQSVTAIAPYAFSNSKLSGITKLNLTGITAIGEGAFEGLNVKHVVYNAADDALPALQSVASRAFAGSQIEAIVIPATVKSIGSEAFADCASLASVTFENNQVLNSVGDRAFAACSAITQMNMPLGADGAVSMGSRVFEGCAALRTVTLPSVKTMGSYNFLGCYALESAVYGNHATATGSYTFASLAYVGYGALARFTSVTLTDSMTELGEGVFAGCTALTSVDLKGITKVNAAAFMSCGALTSVEHLSAVKSIGDYAFAGTAVHTQVAEGEREINLSAAEHVGSYAFAALKGNAIKPVFGSSLNSIGSYAFYRNSFRRNSTVTLPESVSSIGRGAFAACSGVSAYAVEGTASDYFVQDGVLYRELGNGKCELAAYPTGKYLVDKTYTILDGTVTVLGDAFAELEKGTVSKVVLPYSMATIGDAAFFASGVQEFEFHSINAPILLSEYRDIGISGLYTLFYTNYGDALITHTDFMASDGVSETVPSTLRMSYPSNGIGYDNYVYNNYFGGRTQLGELMADDTRYLKELIESLDDVATVSAYNSKDQVFAVSNALKEAHLRYNNIKSEVQLSWLGEDAVTKLFALESAVKPLKAKYGYPVFISSITVDPACKYKTEYKTGEKFSMKGLQLIISYNDYSSEKADMSKMKLTDDYKGELSPLNLYVELEGYDWVVQIPITVADAAAKEKGCKSAVGGGAIAAVALTCAALLTGVCLGKARKTKKETPENTDDEN